MKNFRKRPFRKLMLTLLVTMLLAHPIAAQDTTTKSDDKPTTPTSKPIKLTPVLKKQPVTVKLDPVFKKVEPTKTATPTPIPATPTPVATDMPLAPAATAPQPAPAVAPTMTATADALTSGSIAPPPAAPKTQTRLTAPQLMTQGLGMLDKGQVAPARERFLKLANRYPDAPETPEALLHAANCQPDPAAALEELNDLIARFPEATIIPQARVRQAEFAFFLERYDEAAQAYAAVLAGQPDAETAKLAESRLVVCMARTGRVEELASAGLLEKNPDVANQPEIIAPMADLKLAAGDTAGAGALFVQLEQSATEPAHAAKALLGQALCAELEGRAAEAAELYDRLGQAFPQSPEATLAAYRLVDLAKPLLP